MKKEKEKEKKNSVLKVHNSEIDASSIFKRMNKKTDKKKLEKIKEKNNG